MFEGFADQVIKGQKSVDLRRHMLRPLTSLVMIGCFFAFSVSTFGQPPKANKGANPQIPPPKLTEAQKAAQAVLNAYTDAANFQNNAVYPQAIERWNKFLKSFPNDSLASKARHYLGICYLQIQKPDYDKAIENLREALKDEKLEVREESLLKLGQALYESGVQANGDSKKKKLAEAAKTLSVFLDKYSDGSYADQAIFYAADAEYQLGKLDKAANLYRRLADQESMAKSELRPDAIFALGIVYEEQNQPKLAIETFESFLKSYSKHRLTSDTRLRLAERYLSGEQPGRAAVLLKQLADSKEGELQDYILYRYGFALAKDGKYAESSKVYRELSQRFPKSQYAAGSSLAAGQTLMREKKYDEAKAFFSPLLSLKNENASEAAHLICQIAFLQGKPAEAISVARHAITWSSKSRNLASLKMDLAEALTATKDGQAEAKSLFEQIAAEHSKDPVAPRAVYNAAFASMQAGALADAKRWGETFAKQYPQDPLAPDVAYIAAESTLQLGQHAEAATALEQLLNSQKGNPSAEAWELRLGHAYFIGNVYDKLNSRMMNLVATSKSPETQAEGYFLIGAGLLKQEKFDESEKALNRSLEASTKWASADETLLILSQAQLKAGNSEQARATLDRLRKEYPQSRFANQAEIRIGQLSAAAGDFKGALASYQRILDSDKDKSLKDLATYGKAWVLMQEERFKEALKLIEPLTASDRQDSVATEAILAKAICHRNLNNPKESIAILEKLVNDPKSNIPLTKSLYELGLSYLENKEFSKASASFDRLLKEFPKLEDLDRVLYEYGWAMKEQKQTSEAMDIFEKLSKTFPQSPLAAEAEYHIGQQAYEEGKYDKATAAYSKAINQTSDEELLEKSLYKLGWTYFQLKDFEKASAQFAKQIEIAPKSVLALEAGYMQAESIMKTENYANAFDLFNQARTALESSDKAESLSEQVRTLIYLHGAQSARELKKWKETNEWLNIVLKKFPNSEFLPIAKYEQAFAAQKTGKLTDAHKLYEDVAENNRNEIGARSQFMIGEMYFAEKDFAKAIQEYEKVIYGFGEKKAAAEVKNWQCQAAFEAGRCAEFLIGNLSGNQKAKAIQVAKKFYQIVVDDHPAHEIAPQAQTRLTELKRLAP
jgi:cellulose synthase operon protein C